MMHSFTPHQHLDERGRTEDKMDGRMSRGSWGRSLHKGGGVGEGGGGGGEERLLQNEHLPPL